MTNPGIPPALSRAHQVENIERGDHLKADLDHLLEAIDEALAALASEPSQQRPPTAA